MKADSRPTECAEMLALLIESQTSIGGDWRKRRDALIARTTQKSETPLTDSSVNNSAGTE